MLVHAGSPRAFGVHGFNGETLEEERLSYLRSLQRHAAMEHGEVRSVVALKPGVGDHTPERFADHELGSCYGGGFDIVINPGSSTGQSPESAQQNPPA
jgi:hypothetical protein